MAPVSCIVLHDETTVELAAWVSGVLRRKLIPNAQPGESVDVVQTTEDSYAAQAKKAYDAMLVADPNSIVVVACLFWDGLSASAKQALQLLKTWSQPYGTKVVLQGLNAKKGAHTLTDNEDALVASMQKKLPARSTSAKTTAADDGLEGPTTVEELNAEKLQAKLRSGQGECTWIVAAQEDRFAAAVEHLWTIAREYECGCFAVTPQPREVPASFVTAGAITTTHHVDPTAANPSAAGKYLAQEFVVRREKELEHVELRIAMCGNVDSGKSTLTSVLTRGCRDDGRGLARAFVFNHKHEADTGRTSSKSENHIGFDATGAVVNYDSKNVFRAEEIAALVAEAASRNSEATTMGTPANSAEMLTPPSHTGSGFSTAAAAPHRNATFTAAELAARSAKMVTLIDLAGHEKYLKTTVLGMTRTMPDYACIAISANNSVQRMTKEHLGLCLALKLPFFIVVTRIDATPSNVRQDTTQTILKLLKLPTVKKLPYPIRKPDDVIVAAKNLQADRITPIFEVSNVTGEGIPELLQFINLLPVRKDWSSMVEKPREMVIDSTFFVTGVGTVVGGIVTQGRFRTGDSVWLGPDGIGAYRPVQIKSIHVKGLDVPFVEAGNDAALCLKKEKRSAIRKGNVLLDMSDAKPKSYWQFTAEIVVLYHSTTISVNYEPVIHSHTVRQSARIVHVEQQEVLRTGDRALVRFHFLYRPEFLKVGQRMIFREGRTKGIGTVIQALEEHDAATLGTLRHNVKETVRQVHTKQ